MLSLEIGELGEAGFDLRLTGFDEFELGELFAERTQGRTDPDDAPEPPPQSKRWRPSTHKSPGSATGCAAAQAATRPEYSHL
jgi:hypothetical protein